MKSRKSESSLSPDVNKVEEYIAAAPEPARSTLQSVRASIRAAAPADAVEGFSYAVPAFKLKKGSIAGYAACSGFCSYYPMSGWVITQLRNDLKAYATSSGAIRFPSDQPLPDSLVRKLVETRLVDIERKKKR
ncbi:iron chaperone [Acidicapsa acidisoli]|uniref:iron chaperone n=1 Tax=Acidicapsa acidisoli TaxID=1615681 RepID=UPI0021E089F6|nr:DUF1801 domain-containing protein [Acidicapsa acidisoli]